MSPAMTKDNKNVVGEQDKAWSHAMVLATSCSLPMVLKTVIELDVLEIIKQAGDNAQLSPTEITAKLPTNNPKAPATLDRMLQLLASYSVLTCSLRSFNDRRVERVYGLAPVCQFLTKDQDGHSLATGTLLNQDKVMMKPWYHAKDAILEGCVPFSKAHGKSMFEYYATDVRVSKIFNNSMVDMSTLLMKKILESYNGFEGISTLVDMAGNRGATLNMIISKYPNIKGINFDLPHVINDASEFPGITNIGGDMFVSVPKADAIFMKSVLHNWDDEHCIKFMKNCYHALPDNGKVIACDLFLPLTPETNDAARMAYNMDVLMMLYPNGRERTMSEFEALGKAAGFEGFKIACLAYDFKIVEFIKKN